MGRTRESANLVSDNNIFVDIANDLVGIGVTSPTAELDVSGNAKVSGIITATTFSGSLSGGSVSATTGAFSGDVTLTDTDTGSAAGPELTLHRNSASPSPGDYLGQIMFKGENSNGGEENYAKITGKISDETLGTEDGLIETAIKGDGSFTIVSRQRSDELQLINGVGLSVEGDITANGNVVGDNSTNISGISSVTATSFHGDGANLTNVPTGFSPINFVLS